MFTLDHKVRVFVFHVRPDGIQYLLLRQKPRDEWPLGPVIGAVAPGDKIQDAVLREVRAETGLRRPVHLLEIAQPNKELFGDFGLVEWPFAWQAGVPGEPLAPVTPGPMVGEVAWLPFEQAFRRIELQTDRDALVRLQLTLQ